MELKLVLALIAAGIAVAGNVPYVRDVLRGKVEPHAYTWFVWSIVSCITFFGGLAKGAGVGIIPVGASEIFTIIIFILSLRYGFKDITKLDTLFLILALAGLIPWILFHDPTISVIIAVSIDLIAFLPTLRKTWKHPRTENPLLYGSNVLRHALGLFSLQAYNIATTLHSVAMIIVNTAMVTMIALRKDGR